MCPGGITPPPGAYCGYCFVDNRAYPVVTGITTCPTTGEEAKHSETYIIGFDGDLYGRELDVMLTDVLRAEKKFDGIDGLKVQLAEDAERSEKNFIQYAERGLFRFDKICLR